MQKRIWKHVLIYCSLIMLVFLSLIYLFFPEDMIFPDILIRAFAGGIGGSIGAYFGLYHYRPRWWAREYKK